MAMKKIVPATWDFGDARSSIIGVPGQICTDGICRLVKKAGYIFQDRIRDWKPAPGEVPVHITIVGSTEFYGPNRNGDGFREETCRRYHDTFVKHARFYRNHDHYDPKRSYGIIKFSAYNERMHRIELIGVLNATKEAAERNGGLVADREIHMLERGEDIPVSMSCVVEPDAPVLTREGYKEIAQVSVGDEVMTYAGRWRRVYETKRRKVNGTFVRMMFLSCWPYIMTFTPEHLLYVCHAPRADLSRLLKDKASKFEFNWMRSDELSPDYVVYRPIPEPSVYRTYESDPNYITLLAAAQLHAINRKDWSEQGYLEIRIRDPERGEEVVAALNELKRAPAVSVDPDGHRYWLRIEDPDILSMLEDTVGPDLDRFPHHMNAYGRDTLVLIASSYIRMAERFHHTSSSSNSKAVDYISINMPSDDVLMGLRDTLAFLGVPVQLRSEFNGRYHECRMGIYTGYLSVSVGFIPTVPFNPDIELYRPMITDDGISLVFRVRKHRFINLDEPVEVYNLEVEEDESYILGGFTSHNCTVSHDICSGCGNRARSRAEYCDANRCPRGGLKNNMGRLFKDGHILHADNPDPKFFDVSYVFRPADRSAYVLGRLDDQELLAKSAADARMVRMLPAFGPARHDVVLQHRTRLEKLARAGWNPLQAGILNETLPDDMASRYLPTTILAETARHGILLPPAAFAGVLAGNDVVRVCEGVRKEAADVYTNFGHLCGLALEDGLPDFRELTKMAVSERMNPSDLEWLAEQYGLDMQRSLSRLLKLGSGRDRSPGVTMGLEPGKRLTDFGRRYLSYAMAVIERAERSGPILA